MAITEVLEPWADRLDAVTVAFRDAKETLRVMAERRESAIAGAIDAGVGTSAVARMARCSRAEVIRLVVKADSR